MKNNPEDYEVKAFYTVSMLAAAGASGEMRPTHEHEGRRARDGAV